MALFKNTGMLPIVLLFLLLAKSVWAEDHSTSYQVEVNNDKVTLIAENIPIRKIFNAIEKASGITMRYYGDPAIAVTLDIRNCPILEALELITHNFNLSTVYEGFTEEEELRIAALYIYSGTGSKELEYSWKGGVKKGEENVVSKDSNVPGVYTTVGGVNTFANVPGERDPLISMNAHDPLMTYEQ